MSGATLFERPVVLLPVGVRRRKRCVRGRQRQARGEIVVPAAENLLLDPESLSELLLGPVAALPERQVEVRELQTVLVGREPRGHEPWPTRMAFR